MWKMEQRLYGVKLQFLGKEFSLRCQDLLVFKWNIGKNTQKQNPIITQIQVRNDWKMERLEGTTI